VHGEPTLSAANEITIMTHGRIPILFVKVDITAYVSNKGKNISKCGARILNVKLSKTLSRFSFLDSFFEVRFLFIPQKLQKKQFDDRTHKKSRNAYFFRMQSTQRLCSLLVCYLSDGTGNKECIIKRTWRYFNLTPAREET
jgi:hypothetical protein